MRKNKLFGIRKNYISAIFVTTLIYPACNSVFAQTNFFQEISPQTKIGGEEAKSTSSLPKGFEVVPDVKKPDSAGVTLPSAAKKEANLGGASAASDRKVKLGVDDRGARFDLHEAPSQFQIYIKQSTGRDLPIYGQSLFARPQAYQVDAAAPTPGDYVLGPGDEVSVQVWGGVNFDGSLTVDRNGQVTIPRVGVVNLAGVKASGVSTAIRSQIAQTYTNFELNTNVGRLKGIQVYVVGQARQPGSFTLSSLGTLANAIFASGGPNAQGSMRNIQLKRKGSIVATFDVYDFISKGDKAHDVTLQAGDVIVIPPAGPRVALMGALDQEGIYELKSGKNNTFGDVVNIAGGTPSLAYMQKVVLERVNAKKSPAREIINLSLQDRDLQQSLYDGDLITLLPVSSEFGNAVTLQGNVAMPLRYKWFSGMRVRDLIPNESALITSDYYKKKNSLVQNLDDSVSKQAGGILDSRVRNMVDQINWDYAVIERLDKKNLKTQIIPFNLRKAINERDSSDNVEILAGDVITVLSQRDLKIPAQNQTRLVRLEGEVAAPGLYEINAGETLTQLMQRVGGVTGQAYLYGMEMDRASVRKQQQENLDMLVRRLEAQQQSQILFLMANRSAADAASQAVLMQQQQQLGQRRIEALRQLRSNGRITLELKPAALTMANLPELPLEDGDRIYVPPTPGFVSAVGAINNENVFIYKPGRTVKEIIKIAGLREEAEIDEMFVLRADGSIVNKSAMGVFASLNNLELMPGDTIVVPEKLDRENTRNFVMRQLKDISQILSQFGLGVAAIKAIKNL